MSTHDRVEGVSGAAVAQRNKRTSSCQHCAVFSWNKTTNKQKSLAKLAIGTSLSKVHVEHNQRERSKAPLWKNIPSSAVCCLPLDLLFLCCHIASHMPSFRHFLLCLSSGRYTGMFIVPLYLVCSFTTLFSMFILSLWYVHCITLFGMFIVSLYLECSLYHFIWYVHCTILSGDSFTWGRIHLWVCGLHLLWLSVCFSTQWMRWYTLLAWRRWVNHVSCHFSTTRPTLEAPPTCWR